MVEKYKYIEAERDFYKTKMEEARELAVIGFQGRERCPAPCNRCLEDPVDTIEGCKYAGSPEGCRIVSKVKAWKRRGA